MYLLIHSTILGGPPLPLEKTGLTVPILLMAPVGTEQASGHQPLASVGSKSGSLVASCLITMSYRGDSLPLLDVCVLELFPQTQASCSLLCCPPPVWLEGSKLGPQWEVAADLCLAFGS